MTNNEMSFEYAASSMEQKTIIALAEESDILHQELRLLAADRDEWMNICAEETARADACSAELTAISEALGTNEGHSSVDNIRRLKSERDMYAKRIMHCGNCGDTYFDSGLTVGCPVCKYIKEAKGDKTLPARSNHRYPTDCVVHDCHECSSGDECRAVRADTAATPDD